jgi:hypothetical protein
MLLVSFTPSKTSDFPASVGIEGLRRKTMSQQSEIEFKAIFNNVLMI